MSFDQSTVSKSVALAPLQHALGARAMCSRPCAHAPAPALAAGGGLGTPAVASTSPTRFKFSPLAFSYVIAPRSSLRVSSRSLLPTVSLMPVQMQTFHLLSSHGLVKQIFHPRMTHENHLTLRPLAFVSCTRCRIGCKGRDFSTSQPQNVYWLWEGAKGRGSV
jgi:hypothetical protein